MHRFMPADALWTFAMALNVYLTFFRRYDARQLRTLEWKYIIFCYGLPLVPAFVYLFIDSPTKGRVYGSAIVSSPGSAKLTGLVLTLLALVLGLPGV